MSMINKVTVYECPNGHFEKNKERAVAWHIVSLLKDKDDSDTVSFTGALAMVKQAEQVRALLGTLSEVEG